MGIGIRLSELRCEEESTSGFSKRRRRLRRKRHSDEIQLLIAVIDNASGELIDTFNYVRGEVDSGDVFRPDELFLSTTENSSLEVKLRIMLLEIDGVRQLKKITDKNYKTWEGNQSIAFHSEGNQDNTAIGLGFGSPFLIAAFRHIADADLLAYDEVIVNREQISGSRPIDNVGEEASPFARVFSEGGTTISASGGTVPVTGVRRVPIKLTRRVDFSRPAANRLLASMTYNSEEALSRYNIRVTFSI
ncbi:hypothetical protein B4Q04_09455 [Zobellia sp. OII3]|uniref:hypothetical protein n=1 Tax=Zobellia sp. OII3 TaxID=2034520 RepID=UPI000B5358B0|nr:hypothetical protein [Zobellia sp. OII3]OWW25810.1 hypothetical protein B4Q04_09455 [Zobellia sp. OII3]